MTVKFSITETEEFILIYSRQCRFMACIASFFSESTRESTLPDPFAFVFASPYLLFFAICIPLFYGT